MKHSGGCHCGNIVVEFETAIDPADVEIRECQCSFCRKHGARAAADPQGSLTIRVKDDAKLHRYMFGFRTAEFFICRECGVYVGSTTRDPDTRRGIVIVNVLDDRKKFTREPQTISYDSEDEDERLQRRNERWTPVSLTLA